MKNVTLNTLLKTFSVQEIIQKNTIAIIDVRTPEEYQQEHIPGAKNIPLEKLHEINPNDCQGKTAIFHCRSGHRTEVYQALLEQTPYENKYCLSDGILAWKAAKLPTNNRSTPNE